MGNVQLRVFVEHPAFAIPTPLQCSYTTRILRIAAFTYMFRLVRVLLILSGPSKSSSD
jgi:hypothetical protein